MPDGGGEARLESARLWNRMVTLHHWFRKRRKPWPSKSDFEKHFKGRFDLHSQTIQALVQKFFSNIDTTRTNRKNGLKGVVTDGKKHIAVVGRGLRSVIQGHNKRKAQINSLLSRCKKGSRRWKKLKRSLYRSANRRDRIQRNLLHHAANQTVEFCEQQKIGTLVVGDITEINRGKKKKASRRMNQENGNNPLGQWYTYLEYKLKRIGVVLDKQDEAYTTQQCPVCGHRHKPTGRNYKCRNPECGFEAPRDLVGSSSIRTKYLNDGRLVPGFNIPTGEIKYRRPVKLPVTRPDGVEALTWPMLPAKTYANAVDTLRGEGKSPVLSAA